MRKQGGITRAGMLLSLALLLCLPGCGKKPQTFDDEPEEKGSIFKKNKRTREHYHQDGDRKKSANKKDKKAKAKKSTLPAAKDWKNYGYCEDGVLVDQKFLEANGGMNTPEGVVYQAYDAIIHKNYEDFLALVDTSYKQENHVKRYWWAATQKDDLEYIKPLVMNVPDDPSYIRCREQKEGKDKKIFVGKDQTLADGSNPPITLHKVDNTWKIKRFTAN